MIGERRLHSLEDQMLYRALTAVSTAYPSPLILRVTLISIRTVDVAVVGQQAETNRPLGPWLSTFFLCDLVWSLSTDLK
jgi:hypothetical protein